MRCHYLLELVQTLCAAQLSAALVHLEDDRRVAVGATVLADKQAVQVAEAETTGIAAQFVNDAPMDDLMFALPENQRTKESNLDNSFFPRSFL